MYTWGYLKENTLSKLNLGEEEANQQGFLSRLPYYANEAMTQICSAVKPNDKTFVIEVLDKQSAWTNLTIEFDIYVGLEIFDESLEDYEVDLEKKEAFWEKWNTLHFVDEPITFPEDFISFNDDVAEFKPIPLVVFNRIVNTPVFAEVGDDLLQYYGYNQVICKSIGTYRIPYNARWFFFTKDLQNKTVIPAPADVCDAIPSYMASQCFKIDDEERSAIFRNEYEMFLARIDDTSFKTQRTFTVGGGW